MVPLIRIRSKDGNFRFEVNPMDDGSVLAQKIIGSTVEADPNTITISNKPTAGGEVLLSALQGRTITNLGFKHGDMFFVSYKPTGDSAAPPSAPPAPSTSDTPPKVSDSPVKRVWETVKEDPVDDYWRARDGKIPRARDTQFCKHGPNGMCDYCMPLEPYDSKYHADHNIKHLSFHSYIRKLAPQKPGQQTSSASSLPPLDPITYRAKVPCPSGSHPPYPAGICSKCQPSAITLQSQAFRMVDHLEFSSPELIDRFLGSWRTTGNQRFGWLIGHYAPYEEVPMGIKAIVEAIHEPPQDGELDGLSLELPWDDEKRIEELAKDARGQQIVGYIFTDLTPEAKDRSKSVCKRHADSFYLSSLETLFAARLQLNHPTPTKASRTGVYSSRLVTAVLSGTPDGAIDVQAYMVSEQACAMVDADMVEPSVDPNIVRLKEEEEGRYVPDVFFRFKNEYGFDVKQSAKPAFPVEYMIVTLTHGFPTTPSPAFLSTSFSIENRPGVEEQDVSSVIADLGRLKAGEVAFSQGGARTKDLVKYLSDWHLLAYLGTVGLLGPDDMKVLAQSVTSPNVDDPK
ncbi:nuclear protein localization protein 4, partial [Tulasnella sp. 427]